MILSCGLVESSVVNTQTPTSHIPFRYQLVLIILHDWYSSFLWHHVDRLTHGLSKIGYIISAAISFCSSFTTPFLTFGNETLGNG
jgi:hypothetical protein